MKDGKFKINAKKELRQTKQMKNVLKNQSKNKNEIAELLVKKRKRFEENENKSLEKQLDKLEKLANIEKRWADEDSVLLKARIDENLQIAKQRAKEDKLRYLSRTYEWLYLDDDLTTYEENGNNNQ